LKKITGPELQIVRVARSQGNTTVSATIRSRVHPTSQPRPRPNARSGKGGSSLSLRGVLRQPPHHTPGGVTREPPYSIPGGHVRPKYRRKGLQEDLHERACYPFLRRGVGFLPPSLFRFFSSGPPSQVGGGVLRKPPLHGPERYPARVVYRREKRAGRAMVPAGAGQGGGWQGTPPYGLEGVPSGQPGKPSGTAGIPSGQKKTGSGF